MVAFDIVDYLYDRPVIIGQTIQNHRVALLDDWEPLPVGVELGREISQCRVAGISQDSQCTGRNWAVQVFADSPEHTVIPIIRLEKSAYRLILMFVFRREPKDFAPLCQVFQMGIQIIRHTNVLRWCNLFISRRINPKGIIIPVRSAVYRQGERDFFSLPDRSDSRFQCAYLCQLSLFNLQR